MIKEFKEPSLKNFLILAFRLTFFIAFFYIWFFEIGKPKQNTRNEDFDREIRPFDINVKVKSIRTSNRSTYLNTDFGEIRAYHFFYMNTDFRIGDVITHLKNSDTLFVYRSEKLIYAGLYPDCMERHVHTTDCAKGYIRLDMQTPKYYWEVK
jgi:hypothetical protein